MYISYLLPQSLELSFQAFKKVPFCGNHVQPFASYPRQPQEPQEPLGKRDQTPETINRVPFHAPQSPLQISISAQPRRLKSKLLDLAPSNQNATPSTLLCDHHVHISTEEFSFDCDCARAPRAKNTSRKHPRGHDRAAQQQRRVSALSKRDPVRVQDRRKPNLVP